MPSEQRFSESIIQDKGVPKGIFGGQDLGFGFRKQYYCQSKKKYNRKELRGNRLIRSGFYGMLLEYKSLFCHVCSSTSNAVVVKHIAKPFSNIKL